MQNKNIRVLLTGASGFAGSHLLAYLLKHTDWDFVCICSWKHRGTPERIVEDIVYQANKERVEIITHDLISPITEHTRRNIGEIDYIINIASESHVDRSIEDPVPFIKNNVDLMVNVLEFARKIQPKKILQFSTDEVYGVAPDGVNHKEWSEIIPSNPYSTSKACQEAIAISYWRTYGLPIILTNTMNLFGERQDSEKYIAQLIRKVYKEETITVHGRENYIGSRYYLHARNMADAVLFIMKNIEPVLYDGGGHAKPERFNIVGDVELNNLELAQKVAALLRKELKYELVDFHETRPGHDRRYALDGEKLKKAGWSAPLSFEQSLAKTIDWTLEHQQWL